MIGESTTYLTYGSSIGDWGREADSDSGVGEREKDRAGAGDGGSGLTEEPRLRAFKNSSMVIDEVELLRLCMMRLDSFARAKASTSGSLKGLSPGHSASLPEL